MLYYHWCCFCCETGSYDQMRRLMMNHIYHDREDQDNDETWVGSIQALEYTTQLCWRMHCLDHPVDDLFAQVQTRWNLVSDKVALSGIQKILKYSVDCYIVSHDDRECASSPLPLHRVQFSLDGIPDMEQLVLFPSG